jgi:exodeoxyribonuclease V gamma subunit
LAEAGAGNLPAAMVPMANFVPSQNVPLTISQLSQFLRNPVKAFFKHRLQVVFDETQEENSDDESFGVNGLQQYGLIGQLLATATAQPNAAQEQMCVAQSLAKLRKSGELPLKVFGDLEQQSLDEVLSIMLGAWRAEQARFPHTAKRQSVRLQEGAVVLEDWIDHLRSSDAPSVAWLELQPGKLLVKVKKDHFARADKLLGAWVRTLAIAASGTQAHGILVGRDGVVEIPPHNQEKATETLKSLLQLWLDGMQSPLPLPLKTALAFVAEKDARSQYEGGHMVDGEVQDTCLARMYPNYDALEADQRFQVLAKTVYDPLLAWAKQQVKVAAYTDEADSPEVAA